ncbi:MAG: XRE family transcriptional regulator [Chitinophagaceae bacterium]|nr:MAG: XRE family transcriptional regulator [Chitinophagaceae bacterium]
MEVGKKIVAARKMKGFTQEELSDATHITVRTIQRIESGESTPRAFTVKAIAAALGIEFESLAGSAQPANPGPLITETFPNDSADLAGGLHYLHLLWLSCFSFVLIPFVHFLVPAMLLRNYKKKVPGILPEGRKIIRGQVYWQIGLSLAMLATLAYNLIVVRSMGVSRPVHYLWTYFVFALINSVFIAVALWKLSRGQRATELVTG